MRSCPAGDACGTNEICGDVAGKRRCMALCTDGKCSSGAGCQTYWPTRKQVCSDTVFPAACALAVDETKCSACGPQLFTTLCSSGFVCPSNSACDPLSAVNGECLCDPGYETRACDGSPCVVNGANVCFPPLYSCIPADLPGTMCTNEPHGGSGKCKCTDGRNLPFVCGETNSCEQRCSTGCSLTLQDCPDAWAPKCTLFENAAVVTQSNSALLDRVACTELLGARTAGESCQRVPFADAGTQYGRDDCGKGLLCERTGAPRGELRCRKLCTAGTECGAGEACMFSGLTFPPSGFCLPVGCALGGTDCGAGKSCVAYGNVERKTELYCKFDGTGMRGAACASDAGSGCGPNLSCSGEVCRATCSPQRPCDAGRCEPVWDDKAGPGLCR